MFQEYGVNAIVSLVQKSDGEQLADIVLHPAAIKSIICAISPATDNSSAVISEQAIANISQMVKSVKSQKRE